MKILRSLSIILLSASMFTFNACAQKSARDNNAKITDKTTVDLKQTPGQYKVTFIELGSVKCIPCQKMQTVMKLVEQKYGDQVKIIFYDVWTPEGKPYGDKYGIQSIPTQVFLDQNGNEFSRHEGYFPEEELVKVLNTKGVK